MGIDYKRKSDLLLKALESKGKFYKQSMRRFKATLEDGTSRYMVKYTIEDEEDSKNRIDTYKKDERFKFLLGEWNKYKDE